MPCCGVTGTYARAYWEWISHTSSHCKPTSTILIKWNFPSHGQIDLDQFWISVQIYGKQSLAERKTFPLIHCSQTLRISYTGFITSIVPTCLHLTASLHYHVGLLAKCFCATKCWSANKPAWNNEYNLHNHANHSIPCEDSNHNLTSTVYICSCVVWDLFALALHKNQRITKTDLLTLGTGSLYILILNVITHKMDI